MSKVFLLNKSLNWTVVGTERKVCIYIYIYQIRALPEPQEWWKVLLSVVALQVRLVSSSHHHVDEIYQLQGTKIDSARGHKLTSLNIMSKINYRMMVGALMKNK